LRVETAIGGMDLVLLPSDYIVQIDNACYVYAFDSAIFKGCWSDSSKDSSAEAPQQWFQLGITT